MFDRQQQPNGSFPRNSLLNGKVAPDSFNTQLDECSYPILMAWQLGMNDATLYQTHIKPAADFVISHGPSFGPERWEEQGGFSPSTIAAEVAGLVAAADLADQNHDAVSAALASGSGPEKAHAAGLAVDLPRPAPADLAAERTANVDAQLAELLPSS